MLNNSRDLQTTSGNDVIEKGRESNGIIGGVQHAGRMAAMTAMTSAEAMTSATAKTSAEGVKAATQRASRIGALAAVTGIVAMQAGCMPTMPGNFNTAYSGSAGDSKEYRALSEAKEADVEISPVESQYLKTKVLFFRKFVQNIKGDIKRVHIFNQSGQFFPGVMEIYSDDQPQPLIFRGMGVNTEMLIPTLAEMKVNVREGLSHNATLEGAKVQDIRKNVYHLFDVVDKKVPGEEAEFVPPLENQLGFRDVAHAKSVLNNCNRITVTYSPQQGLANFIVFYEGQNGKYETRASDLIVGALLK